MTRDETILRIATDLSEGETIGRCSLFDVLAATIGAWASLDDYLTLLHGDAEQRLDVTERHRKHHERVSAHWLQTSARGIALVDAEIERLHDEAAEDAEQDGLRVAHG